LPDDKGAWVNRLPNEESAVDRARWLAQLAAALDDARRVVKQLGGDDGRIEAVELYARIEAARMEIRAMQLRRSLAGRQLFDPQWTESAPWQRRA
jgi:hypothetical protein